MSHEKAVPYDPPAAMPGDGAVSGTAPCRQSVTTDGPTQTAAQRVSPLPRTVTRAPNATPEDLPSSPALPRAAQLPLPLTQFLAHRRFQDHGPTHLMHSGNPVIRCDGLPGPRQDGRHGRQGQSRVSSSTARARAATASAGPAETGSAGILGAARRRRRWPGAASSRDDLRVVRWGDHSAKSWTDPEVVFGHMPAPCLGTGPGHGLRPSRRPGGGATGGDPCATSADPAGLAGTARRVRPPARGRAHLRP